MTPVDSTARLIAHLGARLAGVPVHGEVPATRPPRFVTVERVGGPQDRLGDHPLFAVQAWADTKARAALLADETAEAIRTWIRAPEVADVVVSSLYSFPDPDSRQARYQLTVSASLMRAVP